MSNQQRDGFPLADQLLQELVIDLAHVNAPTETCLQQFEKAWQEARRQVELERRKRKLQVACKTCKWAFELLQEQKALGGLPANLSYIKGILHAHQGAIHWARGEQDAGTGFLEESAQHFVDSDWGYYNASVVRMTLAEMYIRLAEEDDSDRSSNLEKALRACHHSLCDLEHSPSSSRQVSLRARIRKRLEWLIEQLSQAEPGDAPRAAGGNRQRTQEGNGSVPNPDQPPNDGKNGDSGEQLGEPCADLSRDAATAAGADHRHGEQSMPLLSLLFGFAPVVSDPISAGRGKPAGDEIRAYPSVESVLLDDGLYSIRPVESGRGQSYRVTLNPTAYHYFIAEVEGESMKGLDIHSGDYVWLQRPRGMSFVPNPGCVVAAVIRGVDRKALLKRYRLLGQVKILEPENPGMEPFEFTDLDEVEFVGEAIAILKRSMGHS
jgi:hypothetical protein